MTGYNKKENPEERETKKSRRKENTGLTVRIHPRNRKSSQMTNKRFISLHNKKP